MVDRDRWLRPVTASDNIFYVGDNYKPRSATVGIGMSFLALFDNAV